MIFKERVHELKIKPVHFDAVTRTVKTFEVRKNDRAFSVGDLLRLREWADGIYTGNEITVRVVYILSHDDFPEAIAEGYVVLAIRIEEGCQRLRVAYARQIVRD